MKDKLKHNALLILDVAKLALLLLLAIMFVQFNTKLGMQTNAIHDTLIQQKTAEKSINDNTNLQLQKLNQHIDCIVRLFRQPERPVPQITNDNCDLQPANTVTSGSSPPKAVQAPAPAPQNRSQSSPSSSSPSSPASSPPASSTKKSPGLLKQITNFLGL